MNDTLILHIETATKFCSVALSEGKDLVSLRESDEERSHATSLARFIRECFLDSGKKISDLDAINVSKGPGSYTGLRIGVSTTKGIAYAQRLPVIATGTLQVMVFAALDSSELKGQTHGSNMDYFLCPMIDARRMEVFTGIFRPDGTAFRKISAEIIEEDSFSGILDSQPIYFFGDGSDKCRSVLKHENAHFIPDIHPSARYMIDLALEAFVNNRFEDVAYFEPYYLKEFIATIPRKKIL